MTKTEMIAAYLRRSIGGRAKAEGWRASETAMSLADVPKQARSVARTKAFRHLHGDALAGLIKELERKK